MAGDSITEELVNQQLALYREKTFRTSESLRLKNKEQAVEFVNQRQFIFFWPIKGILLPSLWVAAAGNRPVPDEHDDPGHITWDWKDSLLDKRVWYYARVLRRRNTIVSLQAIPFFYALSPNYGDPENDYLEQYRLGQLTQESRLIYEALLKEGPLDTITLRKVARLSSPENTSRFSRALDTLQIELKVLPVRVTDAGSWHYAFTYDLTHRYFPELPDQARLISEKEARRTLIYWYLLSVGAASTSEVAQLFSWKLSLQKDVEDLLYSKNIFEVGVQGKNNQTYLVIDKLMSKIQSRARD